MLVVFNLKKRPEWWPVEDWSEANECPPAGHPRFERAIERKNGKGVIDIDRYIGPRRSKRDKLAIAKDIVDHILSWGITASIIE